MRRLISVATIAGLLVSLLLLGCSEDRNASTKPTPTTPQIAEDGVLGTKYYVYDQDDFEYALNHVGLGDTITFQASGWFYPTTGCFSPGSSCLDGVRIEAPYPYHASIHMEGYTDWATFNSTSMENITWAWIPTHMNEGMTMNGGDQELVYTMLGYTDVPAWIYCEGNVTIDSCWEVRLNLQPLSHVDFYSSEFFGAYDMCDQGVTQIGLGAELDVHSWNYGGETYVIDNLITYSQIVAMKNCDWGYLRFRVADADADIGKVYYGDSDCSQYVTSTSVIGQWHYASINLNNFPDGDFYWRATAAYCSDWGEYSTTCKRAKMTRAIYGCPEPLWWPF